MRQISMTVEGEESCEQVESPVSLEGLTPAEAEDYLALMELYRQAGIEGMKQVEREKADLQRRGLMDADGKLIGSNYA